MRLKITKSKNSVHYSIIKDVVINAKRTTKIYENIGSLANLKLRAKDENPVLWLNNYIKQLNIESKSASLPIIIKKYENKIITKDEIFLLNAGYLFLQDIYYSLGLNDICDKIINKYQFKYDLNSILSRLVYSRIIFPSSKLKTLELSKQFLEQPNFDLQHIYRALEVICKESDFIQSELYKNSLKYSKRNDKVLFYDCTNFYFEIEEENGLKKYGKSKEQRSKPIVQMGLFMDGDGIPLAFDNNPGNTNEQITLRPLEEKIINDFNNSKFIVCTDAGLASNANRKFNNTNNRRFVTTQPLKKLKPFLKEWALNLASGWKLPNSDKSYDISKLREDEMLIENFREKVFYKERWIKENDIEQRLIVTYSVKYQEYQKNIREQQINRASKLIELSPEKIGKTNQNDPKRFISKLQVTENGEIATEKYYSINQELILEESKYDGLYAICTNLEDTVEEIIKINKRRWEIEESFRIMKSEFKARPVFLSRDDRIKAHFTTCFLALIIYRYLEKKLEEKYTASELIEFLRNYNLKKENEEGYSPLYTRNDLTDFIHEKYNFRTDYEFVANKNIRKIINFTKK